MTNKILRVHVKDKSCNSPEGLQLYEKETPTQVFSCEYFQSFRNNFFYTTTRIAAFELYFSIRKNFSTTTRAFVFLAKFYYHKIFETRS